MSNLSDETVMHMPGPWDVYGEPTNYHICMADMPHMRVCFLTSDGPTLANARLIAAAPELLEALRLLLKEMELSGNAGSKDYGWPVAITKSRAAIAKATSHVQ